jgi:beta-N-acetylhexosaminidase
MRAVLIVGSALVAILSLISLANPPHRARTAQIVVKPAVQAQPTAAAGAKSPVHHRPKPKPKSLPPATQMTNPSQEAIPTLGSMPLAKMIGQQLMVKFDGTSPDAGLLQRIHDGEVGGVILYGDNIRSPSQVAQLDAELQHAAASGGNPRLLISTDQEGGQVKRFPWAAPTVAPPDMGAQGAAVAYQQGQTTGSALRAAGVNVNLAPVADVALSRSSFIWKQGRSFGMNPVTVTAATAAFAQGMESAGVAPTAKHFPGVGAAQTDTDFALEKIDLAGADLAPYHKLIAQNIPLIMLGTAVYENFDPSAPAALSRSIVSNLLRRRLHYQGVTMSDDLERPTGQATPGEAAVLAARAGIDIILVSSTSAAGATTYHALLSAAESAQIPRSTIEAAYTRILRLKRQYAAP